MTIAYVPLDSVAVAMEANTVAAQLAEAGATVIRNGSRGLAWLEPLIEVQDEKDRVAYGPVTPETVAELISDGVLHHQLIRHPLYIGSIENHDFLRSQHRLVFDRVGYDSPVDFPDPTDTLNALSLIHI